LLSCFEYSLVHISDDRRHGVDNAPPPGVARRIPFIITRRSDGADVDAAYERGAAASVGWPLDDVTQKSARPLQPGQAVCSSCCAWVRDDADIGKIDSTLKRDPATCVQTASTGQFRRVRLAGADHIRSSTRS